MCQKWTLTGGIPVRCAKKRTVGQQRTQPLKGVPASQVLVSTQFTKCSLIPSIRHGPCFYKWCKKAREQGLRIETDSFEHTHSQVLGDKNMADIALKRTAQQGPSIREQLRAMDDAEIVTSFLGGEERAFQELVERYQTRLLNFIYRTIGDREKAEDLVQEVFIRVYRHLHRFDRSKKFSTWAYTIASNLAKNELRNRSRNPLVLFQTIKGNWDDDDRPLQFEDTTARPDDLYRKRHLRELVAETVAKLPEHHRQVFVLRELEGKSYEEIAEITNCNLGTVKSRLNRARNAFAEIIEPWVD
jgi:RNA polymerase sigma-70 factor, ECF subfamily